MFSGVVTTAPSASQASEGWRLNDSPTTGCLRTEKQLEGCVVLLYLEYAEYIQGCPLCDSAGRRYIKSESTQASKLQRRDALETRLRFLHPALGLMSLSTVIARVPLLQSLTLS